MFEKGSLRRPRRLDHRLVATVKLVARIRVIKTRAGLARGGAADIGVPPPAAEPTSLIAIGADRRTRAIVEVLRGLPAPSP